MQRLVVADETDNLAQSDGAPDPGKTVDWAELPAALLPDTDPATAAAAGAVVDPCIFRLGQIFLEGPMFSADQRWAPIHNDIGGLATFFDLMALHDRLPAFNYTDTFDWGLSFDESLGRVVNVNNDQAVVPVNVMLSHYVPAKRIALEKLGEHLLGRPLVQPLVAAAVTKSLAELEYEWQPRLQVGPTPSELAQNPPKVELMNLEPLVPEPDRVLARYFLGHLLFSAYAQQTGMSHVLSPQRSRHLVAAALDFDRAAPSTETKIFVALRKRGANEEMVGWRSTELPWSPSFLPWLVKTQKPGDGRSVLLRRARELRMAHSVEKYSALRAEIAAGEKPGVGGAKYRAEAIATLNAAAHSVARELSESSGEELSGTRHYLVEVVGPVIPAGIGAGLGSLGGPWGAAAGAVAGELGKELVKRPAERLWGWWFERLPRVSVKKLLRRTAEAERELGAQLEGKLQAIWERP